MIWREEKALFPHPATSFVIISAMVIVDRVYGTENIRPSVLIELIKSRPVQRLKGIAQYGVPDKYYIYKNYSRYEHSVGVMILLKKLGASEEEQIAGLLHDISHTAFSHIVDWVVGSEKTETFQDEQHKDFLLNSNASKILKKYGYDPKRIAHYENFGLLEREIPELCADRIDYSIRDFQKSIAKKCFAGMTKRDGKIVFKNKKVALLFAQNFLKRHIEHWAGFEAASRYRVFADVLKLALKEKIIKMDDLWREDEFVLSKIKKAKNKRIDEVLEILEQKDLSKLPKGRTVYKKFRYVDPLFLDKGKLIRLSKVDKEFTQLLKESRKQNEKGIRIPDI